MVTVPPRNRIALLLAALAAGCAAPAPAAGPPPAPPPKSVPAVPVPLVVHQWLALDPVDKRARVPFNANTPFLHYLLDRASPPPEEGRSLRGDLAECLWRAVAAKEDGTVEDEHAAWFYGEVEGPPGPPESVFLAHLDGATVLYVNGAPFVGDLYRLGTGPVPVALRPGPNRLFVAGPRGPWRLQFEPWADGRSPLLREDATLPDIVLGDSSLFRAPVSFRIVNPSLGWQSVRTVDNRPPAPCPPLWVGKSTGEFSFDLGWAVRANLQVEAPKVGTASIAGSETYSPEMFQIEERRADEARRVTFTSLIDGSAQFYGYLPASDTTRDPEKAGIVLSLHGAGVDALNQARSYSAKPDFRIVAPTNRRPFGFDWQDWGEQDAYEVLDHALRTFGGDPARVCLTGHSMGGHGTWHLAANNPERWLAIAPSAGWCSFDTYGGGPRPVTDLTPIWRACDGGSRTEDLVDSLVALPTYVLHGTADEDVPISEAKQMIARIEEAGGHPLHHFQEGAVHWWDGDAAPGADCVDWPGIFDLFRRAVPAWRPRDIDEIINPHTGPIGPASIDWTSAGVAMGTGDLWVHVAQPLEYGKAFRVRAKETPDGVEVMTENVRRLDVDSPGESPLGKCTVDGQVLPVAEGFMCASFLREGGRWESAGGSRRHVGLTAGRDERTWNTSGPFKRAFDHRFVLVVGTKGTDEENRESMELARFHAETWWYRANGNAPVVRDTDLLAREEEFAGRNLILYGNADTNAAWAKVLPSSCPVKARRDAVTVGDRTWTGEGLGAVFACRREGAEDRLVGAFAATGARGTRLGYGLLPFVSGVGYPDYAVFGEEYLRSGDGGVLAAGWFDHRWGLQPGGFAREGGK